MITLGKIFKKGYWKLFLIIIIFLHIFFLINIKFTAWPEMLVRPYLVLHGWLPYKDIIMEHNPLLLVDLTIFYKIFGVGLTQLKIYTWIWILSTDVILFFVAKKLWNLKIALVALIFYIPVQIVYEGNGLWFDLALAPLGLLIYYSLKKRAFLWSGIFLGIAFFIKQTAVWFSFPVLLYFINDFRKRDFKKIILLIEGFLLVLALALGIMAIAGILPYYFQWAVKYGLFYLPSADGVAALPTGGKFLIASFPFLIVLLLFFLKKDKNKDIVFWTLFSLMGVYPRFEFFHFQPALAFLAIGAGISTAYIIKKDIKLLKLILALYLVVVLFFICRFVERNWGKETRFYGQNEINITSFVNASVQPGSRIYVLNYWDSIYAMTQTIPATRPLVPYLPWYLEYSDLEEGLVSDLRLNMPELIVKGEYSETGLGSYSIDDVDELIDRYYSLSFMKDGVQIYKLNK